MFHHGERKGLENQLGSNHCFLNVVIQALWNLQAFRQRLLSEPHWHSTPQSCCYCELKSLFQDYAQSPSQSLPPDGVRRALSSVYAEAAAGGRFKIGRMEDASETLEAILGILHASHMTESFAAPAIPLSLVHVEHASAFGCHPLCFAHDVFGIEYVDVAQCSFCGATGEPSVESSFLYRVYASELLSRARRGSGFSWTVSAGETDPLGALHEIVGRVTSTWTSWRGPPATLPELLHELNEEPTHRGQCTDCQNSVTSSVRWLTRRPRIFTVSLVWPSVAPAGEDIWAILAMLRPHLKMEEIFQVPGNDLEMFYSFHGMICYKNNQHYVALFWCHAKERWIFFDDRKVEEKEGWTSVANFLWTGGYLPTLLFYERSDRSDVVCAELSKELGVANVGDSRAVSIDGSAGTQRLSMDHRPSDPAEARRVREEGGFVTMGRVAGELAISRALGDLLLKSSGLSCRPSVRAHDAKRDLALVVASDGLWDFVEEKARPHRTRQQV
ncbi:unnamed protein product [Durusdinium trenchii]|uniref:Uncharacterized protein n=1 Tax=Durusdinium trenchii TaxID=1381693 RepID=A0ABP0NZH7_9DINO